MNLPFEAWGLEIAKNSLDLYQTQHAACSSLRGACPQISALRNEWFWTSAKTFFFRAPRVSKFYMLFQGPPRTKCTKCTVVSCRCTYMMIIPSPTPNLKVLHLWATGTCPGIPTELGKINTSNPSVWNSTTPKRVLIPGYTPVQLVDPTGRLKVFEVDKVISPHCLGLGGQTSQSRLLGAPGTNTFHFQLPNC